MSGQAWASVLCQLVGEKSGSIAMHWLFFREEKRKICFEGVGNALLCTQWMLMCTSANHYNILQIPDCWDIPQILLEIASYQFGILGQVLELRYFGQYENLTIYVAVSPSEHEKAQSGGPRCCHVSV